jgi:hypothetical protein
MEYLLYNKHRHYAHACRASKVGKFIQINLKKMYTISLKLEIKVWVLEKIYQHIYLVVCIIAYLKF